LVLYPVEFWTPGGGIIGGPPFARKGSRKKTSPRLMTPHSLSAWFWTRGNPLNCEGSAETGGAQEIGDLDRAHSVTGFGLSSPIRVVSTVAIDHGANVALEHRITVTSTVLAARARWREALVTVPECRVERQVVPGRGAAVEGRPVSGAPLLAGVDAARRGLTGARKRQFSRTLVQAGVQA
jgi:hypothetical protein